LPDLVNLVRPDGTILQVEAKNAGPLLAAGYKEETLESQSTRAKQKTYEDYYSSAGEKFKTAIEGLGSGLTLGLSDKMLEGMQSAGLASDDWRKRADYNPGTRMASELTGEILPAVLSGGESLALKGVPAVGLTRLGEVAGEKIGGSLAKRMAIEGAVQGAGFGAGQEIRQSALTGDPLTVEGTLAGMGWGAVWGGGTGGVLGGLSSKVEGSIARREAAQEALRKSDPVALVKDHYPSFSGQFREAGESATEAFKTAEKDIQVAQDALEGSRATHAKAVDKMQEEGRAALMEASQIRGGYFNEMSVNGLDKFTKAEKLEAIDAFNRMKSALKGKDWGALEEASTRFQDRLKAIGEKRNEYTYLTSAEEAPTHNPFKATETKVDPVLDARVKTSTKALEDLKDLGVAAKNLRNLPVTAEEFVRMSPARTEKVAAGIDSYLGHGAAELVGRQEAIKTTIADLADKVGVSVEGPPSTQFRGIAETLRNLDRTAGDAAEAVRSGVPLWKRGATVGTGIAVSKATGTGWMGYALGKQMVSGLLNMKSAVVGRVSSLAQSWAPGVLKAAQVVAPKAEPLKVRLDGSKDKGEEDRRELTAKRAKEIREAAPNLNDTLYRAVTPLTVSHPEFAAGLHETAIKQFQFILDKLPQDPGNANNRLASMWRPSALEAEKFSRYYQAFQDPMAVMRDALESMKITSEGVEGLREMWPALYTHLRTEMMERLSDPRVMDKIPYNVQVRMGTLLGLPIHSSMSPQFISSQQQMYQERNQPLKGMGIPPQPGAQGGGGRPPGPAQSPGNRVTLH
jgi:hypothetical protein